MAASFDADAQEELDLQRQNAGDGGDQRDGILRNLDENSQSAILLTDRKKHSLNDLVVFSPIGKRATETPQPRRSGTPTGTPPTAYRTAITSYDESASISAQAFSRRRPLPSSATDGSMSIDQRKQTGGMYFAFGDASKDNADEEELLSQSQLLPSTSPVWEGLASRRTAAEGNGRSSRASMSGSMTASRSGRQSVAPGDTRQSQSGNHVQQMTLRDQQQDHEKLRTENFSLRLENASLKELVHKKVDRDKAELYTENASLKATIEALMQSTKQSKKVVIQLQRALEKSAKEQAEMEDNLRNVVGENGELYKLRQDIRDEEDARIAAENKVRALEDDLDQARHSRSREEAHDEQEDIIFDLRERLEDAEHASQGHRDECDRKDEELDDLKAKLAKLSEDRDRLQDQLEDMQAGVGQQEEQKGLESRLHEQIDSLTSEKASLQREMEALRRTIETRDEEDQDNERLRHEIRDLEGIIGEKNEALEQYAAMEDDFDETRALLQEKQAALEESDARHGADLSELDNQWRTSLSQAEDRIQVLEEDLAEMEERWRIADQQLLEKAAEADTLRDEIEQLDDQIAALISDKERLIEELQEADREVRESDLTRDAVNGLEDEVKALRDAEEHALHERDSHRRTVDELSRQLAGIEAERRTEMEQNRNLVAEKTELLEAAQRNEKQHNTDIEQFQNEMEHEVQRWKRMIGEKEQSNVRMSQELETMRDRLAQKDGDVRDLQDALNNLENARRRLGDERSIDQYSSQLEIDRVKRDLASSEDQLNRALEDIQDLEATLSDKQAELADMVSQGPVETLEQGIAKQAESDASGYRDRIEELERRLSDDRRGLTASVRQTDKAGKEAQDLLRTVYIRVSQVLGLDEDVPSTSTALREKLSVRLKHLTHLTTEYERKIRAVEIKLEHGISNLNRELDSKKRLLDNVETSVNKVAHAKQEWRAKLLAKEEELAQAKAYQREAALELATYKASNSAESSSELRSLQVKASSGDKRVNALSNQLNELHSTIAAQEAKHADATTKWEDRVREYEKRLKAAAEKVKTEKQGGKERVNHLEKTVRELNEQIKALRAKESRLTAIVNAASFSRHDPDAL
ncbi:hypothetical protein QFC22_003048 [Naganishia vaughanmartiniae]|uniref:Uncharacterized protein n=1 Tax=Naganishia vaughanmartiniae TaxID=1424756 RepID=A0ACC2X9W8_9TREE|nr:hypothetical protein QFC22_003048 [Naganishia vaughanmartiniae]